MATTYQQRIEWSLQVIDNLQEYCPLTLRQIFYQLVSRLFIPNTSSQYKGLSRALSKGRKEGLIPWEVIEDRTRPLYGSAGWENSSIFLTSCLKPLPQMYQRNLMRDQDYYFEIFVEKQALIRPFEIAASRYHLFVNMGRGYSSTTVIKKIADRLLDSEERGYTPIILAFSDLDPSGIDLVDNLSRQFRDFEIEPIVERIALTPNQVELYDLPHDPNALKLTDSRARTFVSQYGRYAVELDALSPDVLQDLVHNAINGRLIHDLFETQAKREQDERNKLSKVITSVLRDL